jgi:hypothetical protein
MQTNDSDAVHDSDVAGDSDTADDSDPGWAGHGVGGCGAAGPGPSWGGVPELPAERLFDKFQCEIKAIQCDFNEFRRFLKTSGPERPMKVY